MLEISFGLEIASSEGEQIRRYAHDPATKPSDGVMALGTPVPEVRIPSRRAAREKPTGDVDAATPFRGVVTDCAHGGIRKKAWDEKVAG